MGAQRNMTSGKRMDPDRVWAAVVSGLSEVREWLRSVPEHAWSKESVLPGWTVSDLAAHISLCPDAIAALHNADRGAAPLTIGEYVNAYAGAAQAITGLTRAAAGGAERTSNDAAAAIDDALEAARQVVESFSGDPVVQARRGPIRLSDFLCTRAVEVAVHADDLGRSVPDLPAPTVPRDTMRIAVRALLGALVERAPGRSVEVRVPPIAAAQCIDGPRHTRGTPPNVIETDPTTWLRLAAGRTSWRTALSGGRVSASGERADLAAHLPIF